MASQDLGQDSSLAYSVLENDADAGLSFQPQRGASGTRASGCVTRVLRASCPHFVLLMVYLAFILIGGGFFVLLENKLSSAVNEADMYIEAVEYELLKDKLAETIQNLTKGTKDDGNLTNLWRTYLSLVEEPYLLGLPHAIEPEDLSFTRSVMFCATTIATIGYNDAVPNSVGGKVLVVVFSLIGIPLTLIVLADMGKLLARGVAFLVDKWRYRGARGAAKRAVESDEATAGDDPQAPVFVVAVILIVYFTLGSCFIALIESWSYEDALYFTFIALTTIGFGDIVPVSHYDHVTSFISLLIYIFLGLSVVSMCFILLRARVLGLISKVAGKVGF